MNIAITGATGYIGSNLVNQLALHHRVTVLIRKKGTTPKFPKNVRTVIVNFNNLPDIRKSLRGIEVVFHLAGALPNLPLSNKEYYETNSFLSERVYKASLLEPKMKHFVLCSTAFVTWKNNHVSNEDTSPRPNTIYEKSKLLGESLVKSLSKNGNLPVTIVRPGFVYGPKNVGLLSLCKAIKMKKFFYIGSGNHKFELTHIDDLTRFFLLIINNPKSFNETFLVSARRPLTFMDITKIISKKLNVHLPNIHIPHFIFSVVLFPVIKLADNLKLPFPISLETYKILTLSRSFNVTKSSRILDYRDKVNHRLAITQLIQWYRQKSFV